MGESPIEALERWEEHGAQWRAIHVSDERAVVDLCTCYGEPVDRLESSDARLIAWLRERLGARSCASPPDQR
jgi:hypothetical protein